MKKLNESKQEYELTDNQQQHSDDEEPDDSTQQNIQISKDEDINEDVETKPFKRNFGNNWVCLFIRGEPLLTVGPHWPLIFCMVGTFGLMSYFLLAFIVIKKPPFWYYLSWVVSITQTGSYILCALINPGIVTAKKQPDNSAALQCLVCNNPRTYSKLYHCEDCDVCVEEYDHHCPWTGKCIAKYNLPFFYVFVTMIPVYLVYFLVVSVV